MSDQVIAEDYGVHGDEGTPDESWPRKPDDEGLPEMAPPRSETILATLDYLRSQYGSIRSYLAAGGLTSSQLDRLILRLCEPVGDDL